MAVDGIADVCRVSTCCAAGMAVRANAAISSDATSVSPALLLGVVKSARHVCKLRGDDESPVAEPWVAIDERWYADSVAADGADDVGADGADDVGAGAAAPPELGAGVTGSVDASLWARPSASATATTAAAAAASAVSTAMRILAGRRR